VTYKKFGRKYEVKPGEEVPETRASKRRAYKTKKFFARARAELLKPPTLPTANEGYTWATTGKGNPVVADRVVSSAR
jgi:hypothetical protein